MEPVPIPVLIAGAGNVVLPPLPPLPPNNPLAPQLVVTPEQLAAIAKAAGDLSPTLKKYWPYISAAILFVASLGAAAGWWTKPATVEVPVVVPGPVAPASKIEPPPVPKIIAPSQAPRLVTAYITDAATATALAGDADLKTLLDKNGIKLTVDPTVYEVGSTYPGGTLLPCAAITTGTGKLLTVAPFASGADLAAAVRRHIPIKVP